MASFLDSFKYTHYHQLYSSSGGCKFAHYIKNNTNSGTNCIYFGRKKSSSNIWNNAIYCNFGSSFMICMKNAVVDCVRFYFWNSSGKDTPNDGPVYLYARIDDSSYNIDNWKASDCDSQYQDGSALGDNQSDLSNSNEEIYITDKTNCERFRQKILSGNYIFLLQANADKTEYNDETPSKCDAFIVQVIWHYKNAELSVRDFYYTGTDDYYPTMSFYFNSICFSQNSSDTTYSQEYEYKDNINIFTSSLNKHRIKYRYYEDTANSANGWQRCAWNTDSGSYDAWSDIDTRYITHDSANNIYEYNERSLNTIFENSLFDYDSYKSTTKQYYTTYLSSSYYKNTSSEKYTFGTSYNGITGYLNTAVKPSLTVSTRSVYNCGDANAPVNHITYWTGDTFTYSASSMCGAELASIALNYPTSSVSNKTTTLSGTSVSGQTINSSAAFQQVGSTGASLTVTDTRGRKATVTPTDVSYVEYVVPKFNSIPTVQRTNASRIQDDDGSYITAFYNIYRMKDIYFTERNYATIRFKVMQGSTDMTGFITEDIGKGTEESANQEIFSGSTLLTRTNFTGIDQFSTSKTYQVNDVCVYNNHRYVCHTKVDTAGAFTPGNWTMQDFEKDKTYTVLCEITDLAWIKKGNTDYKESLTVGLPCSQYVLHIKNNGKAIGVGTVAGDDSTLSSSWDIRTVSSTGIVKAAMSGGGFDSGNGVAAGKKFTVTLTSSGWSDNYQDKDVTGLLADADLIVSPAVSSRATYIEKGVYCSGQVAGRVTFTCATTPTTDITVNIIALGGLTTLS